MNHVSDPENPSQVCMFGIRFGVPCHMCRSPATFSKEFESLCGHRPVSLITSAHMTDIEGFKWCATAFSAYCATNMHGYAEVCPVRIQTLFTDDEIHEKLKDLCDTDTVRSIVFEGGCNSSGPRWNESGALWCLSQWYYIMIRTFKDVPKLEGVTLCWFYVWAHAVWSIRNTTVHCELSKNKIPLSVSLMSTFQGVADHLQLHQKWDRIPSLEHTLCVNETPLNTKESCAENVWKVFTEGGQSPRFQRVAGQDPDGQMVKVGLEFKNAESEFWNTTVVCARCNEALLRDLVEKLIKLLHDESHVGSPRFKLLRTEDLFVTADFVASDHRELKTVMWRVPKTVSFGITIPVIQELSLENWIMNSSPERRCTVVSQTCQGTTWQFKQAVAGFFMYYMAQMKDATVNDGNVRVFNRVKSDVEKIREVSLADYSIHSRVNQVNELIMEWLLGFYEDNTETMLKLIDFVADLSRHAQIYQNSHRIVVYHIVCDDGNLCVPMERLE